MNGSVSITFIILYIKIQRSNQCINKLLQKKKYMNQDIERLFVEYYDNKLSTNLIKPIPGIQDLFEECRVLNMTGRLQAERL